MIKNYITQKDKQVQMWNFKLLIDDDNLAKLAGGDVGGD